MTLFFIFNVEFKKMILWKKENPSMNTEGDKISN